ncbi:putative iron compound ABC transporter, periplasmic iron-compound-binding protein [Burkholderia pseudomallei MSHR2990]|nr:putative iron compound ABC transporter, periplasmic iron-compound-binding protein [Burkholderia pseudomallei MSHR2990]
MDACGAGDARGALAVAEPPDARRARGAPACRRRGVRGARRRRAGVRACRPCRRAVRRLPAARRRSDRIAVQPHAARAAGAHRRARIHVRRGSRGARHHAGRHGRSRVLPDLDRLRRCAVRARVRRRHATGAEPRGDRGREAGSDPRRRAAPRADLRRAVADRADRAVQVQPELHRGWPAGHAVRLGARDPAHDRLPHRARARRAGGSGARRRGARPRCAADRGGRARGRARRMAAGARPARSLLGVHGQQRVGGHRARARPRAVAGRADARRHRVRDVGGSAEAAGSRGAVRERDRAGRAARREARFEHLAIRAGAPGGAGRARRAQHLGVRRPDVGVAARRRDDAAGAGIAEARGRRAAAVMSARAVGAGRRAGGRLDGRCRG